MLNNSKKPLRILHVFGAMNRGGAETGHVRALNHLDRKQFQMDCLVNTTEPCAYDAEIRALGSQIIPCLNYSKPWVYAQNFKKVLRDYGPYDVIHSHVYHFSGYILFLAWQAGVKMRIAHSHMDGRLLQKNFSPFRQIYSQTMKQLIRRFATLGLAVSRPAAADLFGPKWEHDRRWRVLYYGIDLAPFRQAADAQALRFELGIPADAFVLGHVGRFTQEKNHTFLLDIAAEVCKREPKTYLLLVGDGPLRPDIAQKAQLLGLADHVIFAGLRSDVPQLMQGAMDAFVLPSFYEGLPTVIIEAQAAGLPCVISDVIAEETTTIKSLIWQMSLNEPASAWAKAILLMRNAPRKIAQTEALTIMEQSFFNILQGVKLLQEVYDARP